MPDLLRLPDLTAAATLSCDGIQTAPSPSTSTTTRGYGASPVAVSSVLTSRPGSRRPAAGRPYGYRGLTPISDRELAARLEPPRPASSPRQRPGSDRPTAPPASALDAWLAKRAATVTAASVEQPDPPSVP